MPSALSNGGVFSVISYGTGAVLTTLRFSSKCPQGNCKVVAGMVPMPSALSNGSVFLGNQLRHGDRAYYFAVLLEMPQDR
jgi:hypothetical protein